MNKEQRAEARKRKLAGFNPDENGLAHHGLFGLPFGVEESEVVLLPVPWEVTVSYREGTAAGPAAILKASQQIDLYDALDQEGWKRGIAMDDLSPQWQEAGRLLRAQAHLYFQEYAEGELLPQTKLFLDAANQSCDDLRLWVKNHTGKLLDEGKSVGVVGGDHSVPLGFMEALAEREGSFGILQIDAHADLRIAYEGFVFSHASIMYNATQLERVEKLVQVGIRDYSHHEQAYVSGSGSRVQMFTDHWLKKARFEGKSWSHICDDIVKALPPKVYISFDIDGLQPWLCPHTGTPVPGGLSFEEAVYLLEKVSGSGRKIIGFDLCEVAPGGGEDEWDANVGSRILYKLCLLTK